MTDGPGDSQPPITQGGGSSWSIHWRGALAVVLVVAVALVAWRWIDDVPFGSIGSNDSDSAGSADSTTVTTAAPVRSTTTVPRTTTTAAPTTTTTTTTIAPGPRVDISGEVKPCRFGNSCLVASFTIFGFEGRPDRYVCVYPNSRSEFGFASDGEDDACFSSDEGDTIAIEVDGVISNPISADNLTGE